jgi:hypothetical protein
VWLFCVQHVPDHYENELKAILLACQQASISVFVVGAFSVRAYNCLLRPSRDLDLAVSRKNGQALKEILTTIGYSIVTDGTLWITATRGSGRSQIELNVALDGITNLNSASTFLITEHQPKLHQPSDLNFSLPKILSLLIIFIMV